MEIMQFVVCMQCKQLWQVVCLSGSGHAQLLTDGPMMCLLAVVTSTQTRKRISKINLHHTAALCVPLTRRGKTMFASKKLQIMSFSKSC